VKMEMGCDDRRREMNGVALNPYLQCFTVFFVFCFSDKPNLTPKPRFGLSLVMEPMLLGFKSPHHASFLFTKN